MKRLVPLFLSCVLSVVGSASGQAADGLLFESGLIFPPDYKHNHASCIVECPNGDLLACWYHGSGERTADDVTIEGARKRKGERMEQAVPLADEPGFPTPTPAFY